MRILLLVPLLLLHGCANSVRKDTESPESAKDVFLKQVCNTVTYTTGQNGPEITGERSVNGRIRLRPLIHSDEHLEIYDSLGAIITTETGEKISTDWPGLADSMTVTTKWKGTDWVSYRDRKRLWDRAASQFDPSQTYRIDLEMTYRYNNEFSYVSILRVSKNGKTIIDRSVCKVHGLRMKLEAVKTCSASEHPEYFFPKQKNEFPNDGNYYSGCGSGSGEVWKCAACNRSYSAWAKKHGLK